MVVADLFAPEILVLAFAGGAFGASIGALPSFSLAGLVVVVGEIYRVTGATLDVGSLPVDVTGDIGFGVVLGPHVAFAGGAAALAYVTKRDNTATNGDFEYHGAKEVTRGLGNEPDVLAVGGVFGVVGYLVATVSGALSVPVDPVALGVVGSALAHRVALGYSVVGSPAAGVFDMSPYERFVESESDAVTDGGRPVVEPWLPYQYRFREVTFLGVVVGVLGGYVAYLTASPFLAFGISVVALVMLNAGVAEIPVTHHLSLPASTAVLALVDAPGGPLSLTPELVASSLPLWVALVVGAVFGILGALTGELLQRVFYAHAETHLDPPAASIVLTSFVIGVLAIAGVFADPVWVPVP